MNRRGFFRGVAALTAGFTGVSCKGEDKSDTPQAFANSVVSNPIAPFIMANSFEACSNGKIFVGLPNTDPTNPRNQIPVLLDGQRKKAVQVPQPISINAAGYPVYRGQVAKLVTTQNYSMAVYDSNMVQQFYWANLSTIDPGAFNTSSGFSYIGQVNSFAELRFLVPSYAGQRVLLSSWNKDITPYGQASFGGGEFIAVSGDASDDGGFIAKVSKGWYWQRIKDVTEATIKDFGGIPDGKTLVDDAVIRMFTWSYGARAQSNVDTLERTIKDNQGALLFGPGEFAIGNVDLTPFGRKQGVKIYGDPVSDYKNLNTTLYFTAGNGYAITGCFLQYEVAGFNLIGKYATDTTDTCGFINNVYASTPQTMRARGFHIQYVGGKIFNATDTQDTKISQVYMEFGASSLIYARWSGNPIGGWDHNTAVVLQDISVWNIKENSVIFLPRCHQSEISNVWISNCDKPGNISQGDWKFTGVFQLEGNKEDFYAQEAHLVGFEPGTQGSYGISYTEGSLEIPSSWDDNSMGVPDYVTDPTWERGRTLITATGVEVSYGAVQTCFYASRNSIRHNGSEAKWYKLGDIYLPAIGQSCDVIIQGVGGYDSASGRLSHTYDSGFGGGRAVIGVQNKDGRKIQVTWFGENSTAVADVKYTGSGQYITLYVQIRAYSASQSVFVQTDAPARTDAGLHFRWDFSGNYVNISTVRNLIDAPARWMVGNATGTGGIGADMDQGTLLFGVNLKTLNSTTLVSQGVPVQINGTLYYLPLIKG